MFSSSVFLMQISDERNKVLYGANIDCESDISVFGTAIKSSLGYLESRAKKFANKPLGLFLEYEETRMFSDIAIDEDRKIYFSLWEDIYSDNLMEEVGNIYSAKTDDDIFVYAECTSENGLVEYASRRELDENTGKNDFPLTSPLYRIEADFYSRGEYDIESIYDFDSDEPFEDIITKVYETLKVEAENDSVIDFYLEVHAVPVGPGAVDRRYIDDIVIVEYSSYLDSETDTAVITKTSLDMPSYLNLIVKCLYHPAKGIHYEEPVHIFS